MKLTGSTTGYTYRDAMQVARSFDAAKKGEPKGVAVLLRQRDGTFHISTIIQQRHALLHGTDCGHSADITPRYYRRDPKGWHAFATLVATAIESKRAYSYGGTRRYAMNAGRLGGRVIRGQW